MLKRAAARSKATLSSVVENNNATTATTTSNTKKQVFTSPKSVFHATDPNSIPSDELIERVRLKITNAHIFKLPPKPDSGGWRGAGKFMIFNWRDKVWQGTLKIVERGEETAVLLVDAQIEKNIFAVCPVKHNIDGKNNIGNGIDRCIDSSRYFVLRIQNAEGRHMYIGLAFNERNDAFDFNTALEDSRREKETEQNAKLGISSMVKGIDYKMKEGEKIRVSIPTIPSAERRREAKKSGNTASGGFLKASSKDTPSRMK